ncbi:MAG: hypothetical protein KDD47_10095, partial [Acidobacteria bacterium]|nr:hypothetical protein [Acidobacteriota bacterium]
MAWPETGPTPALLDPCAGDGEALAALVEAFPHRPQVFACEMERRRAQALKERFPCHQGIFHGDAFGLRSCSESQGAALCYLNPPYDHDPDFGRLEHRFLVRFTSFLAPGYGWLLYVVPAAAVRASAAHLAQHFEDLSAYRFPDPEYQAFGQVVVLGRRRSLPARVADPFVLEDVETWGERPGDLPPLPERPSPHLVEWSWEAPADLSLEHRTYDPHEALEGFRVLDHCGYQDRTAAGLLGHTYSTAAPPRAAHIALALSAGLFNGQEIEPNEPGRFPSLLVKGVFRRELLRIKENRDEEGAVESHVDIEQPRL